MAKRVLSLWTFVNGFFPAQGHANSLGCPELVQAPCEFTKGFVDPFCPLHVSWILRDLCLYVL